MMNNNEFLEFQEAFFNEIREIGKRKNNDYTAGSSDPFGNFRLVESYNVTSAEIGLFTRMSDKMGRIGAFVANGDLQVKDESVTDTLRDLACYCSILAGLLEERREDMKNNEESEEPPKLYKDTFEVDLKKDRW
jgi:hypothetical protein